jgi:hypothetical protein
MFLKNKLKVKENTLVNVYILEKRGKKEYRGKWPELGKEHRRHCQKSQGKREFWKGNIFCSVICCRKTRKIE